MLKFTEWLERVKSLSEKEIENLVNLLVGQYPLNREDVYEAISYYISSGKISYDEIDLANQGDKITLKKIKDLAKRWQHERNIYINDDEGEEDYIEKTPTGRGHTKPYLSLFR